MKGPKYQQIRSTSYLVGTADHPRRRTIPTSLGVLSLVVWNDADSSKGKGKGKGKEPAWAVAARQPPKPPEEHRIDDEDMTDAAQNDNAHAQEVKDKFAGLAAAIKRTSPPRTSPPRAAPYPAATPTYGNSSRFKCGRCFLSFPGAHCAARSSSDERCEYGIRRDEEQVQRDGEQNPFFGKDIA